MKILKSKVLSISLIALMLFNVNLAFAAQTPLTVQTLKENNYAVQAGDLTLTFTACDNVNGNSFASTGKEVLIVQNSDAAGAHTFTVTSVPDSLGRSDTTLTGYSLPLSTFAVIYVNTIAGWKQGTGLILLACNSNLIKFAVVQVQH